MIDPTRKRVIDVVDEYHDRWWDDVAYKGWHAVDDIQLMACSWITFVMLG